ncbi:MAG TPA: hypothetical protein PLG94_15975 [Smithellaceae bacterium]|nr:hypothetical protein [Smithellaceae bacterium]
MVEKEPVDLIGKLEKRMLPIKNLIQTGKKQLALSLLNGDVCGSHKITSF